MAAGREGWEPWSPITVTVEYDVLGCAWCAHSGDPRFMTTGSDLGAVMIEVSALIKNYVEGWR